MLHASSNGTAWDGESQCSNNAPAIAEKAKPARAETREPAKSAPSVIAIVGSGERIQPSCSGMLIIEVISDKLVRRGSATDAMRVGVTCCTNARRRNGPRRSDALRRIAWRQSIWRECGLPRFQAAARGGISAENRDRQRGIFMRLGRAVACIAAVE